MDAEQIRDGVKFMQQGEKAYVFFFIKTKPLCLLIQHDTFLEPLKVFLENQIGMLLLVTMNVQVKIL